VSHPLIERPPLTTGDSPALFCHTIGAPAASESAAVSVSACLSGKRRRVQAKDGQMEPVQNYSYLMKPCG
jgi:hypothetical protein